MLRVIGGLLRLCAQPTRTCSCRVQTAFESALTQWTQAAYPVSSCSKAFIVRSGSCCAPHRLLDTPCYDRPVAERRNFSWYEVIDRIAMGGGVPIWIQAHDFVRGYRNPACDRVARLRCSHRHGDSPDNTFARQSGRWRNDSANFGRTIVLDQCN